MPAKRASGRVSVACQRACIVEMSEIIAGIAIPFKACGASAATDRAEDDVRKTTASQQYPVWASGKYTMGVGF